jgi:hypothetical protein
MNIKETRQYEMLLRLRDFSNTHGQLLEASPVAKAAFASINAAINELTATDLLKLSASVSARADRKAIARKALIELLVKVSQLARVLRARGQTTPPFVLPASKSDQMLLTTGRQFTRDAESVQAEFGAHGFSPKVIADATTALEDTTRDRGMKRADHVAALTRIRDLLAAAMLDVKQLDLIVDNELADNNPMRAVWKQARRIESSRGSRGSTTAGGAAATSTPAPPTDPVSEVEPVERTVDAPKGATVIEMPSRTAA